MAKLRTLGAAIDELRERDPETSLTRYALRRAVLEGRVPCIMIGRKRLVDVDNVIAAFLAEGGQDNASAV
ncbi:MAG: hypothetical protein LBK56_05900 [Gracilibacteraceae bacterium]|jgi:hypothetical protein|nr:hypothetical protein [Gracilibacteraceae bacterium]